MTNDWLGKLLVISFGSVPSPYDDGSDLSALDRWVSATISELGAAAPAPL